MELKKEEDAANIHMVRLLEPEYCARFIDESEKLGLWAPSVTHQVPGDEGQFDPDYWDSMLLPEGSCLEHFADIKEKITSRLSRFLSSDSSPRFLMSGLILAKYSEGGHLAFHPDAAPDYSRWRRYSLVCYLNDDFEGGGTTFKKFGTTYRGKPGECLLFPAHYIHRGDPVITGTKYVVVFFFGDPLTSPAGF